MFHTKLRKCAEKDGGEEEWCNKKGKMMKFKPGEKMQRETDPSIKSNKQLENRCTGRNAELMSHYC